MLKLLFFFEWKEGEQSFLSCKNEEQQAEPGKFHTPLIPSPLPSHAPAPNLIFISHPVVALEGMQPWFVLTSLPHKPGFFVFIPTPNPSISFSFTYSCCLHLTATTHTPSIYNPLPSSCFMIGIPKPALSQWRCMGQPVSYTEEV